MIHMQRISLNSSHITITDRDVIKALKDGAWLFLNTAYKWVPGGFKSFTSETDLGDKSYAWYLVYDGEAPTPEHLDWQHVYGFTVYRLNHGLKAVAFAKQALPKPGTTPYTNEQGKEITEYTLETDTNNAKALEVDFRKRRDAAVRTMMRDACERGWCEVSGKPEEMLLSMGATKIPAQQIADANMFNGHRVRVCDDGYHYVRRIGGKLCTKIALGNGFKP